MDAVRMCPVHEDRPAVTECASCERDLCGACWGHDVDERPMCDACVKHLRERSPWVLPASFAAFAGLLSIALPLRWLPEDDARGWVFGSSLLIVAFATYFLYRSERRGELRRLIEPRDRVEDATAPPPGAGGPYRGRPARRIVERVLPVWSGEQTALALVSALGLSAVFVPLELDLAPWLLGAAILAAWWVIWFGAFFFMLYRGRRVADDHGPLVPSELPPGQKEKLPGPQELLAFVLVMAGMTGPQGILIGAVIAGLLAIPVFTGFGIALVVPVVFLGAYVVIGRAVRFVANDAPDCVGELGPSALRAFVFATTFTVPIGALAGAAWLAVRAAS